MQNTQSTEAQPTELIALPEVFKISGFKTANIYNMLNKISLPKKVHLGSSSVRWIKAEVLQWVNEQLAARIEPPRAKG